MQTETQSVIEAALQAGVEVGVLVPLVERIALSYVAFAKLTLYLRQIIE